ncbi:MAG: RNA methyltransferase [Chromatiales bacterium]|nr:RNA methyltransferase [Chromatiales bacterium]
MVETSHPGNIGAAARAMKNMYLNHLYLVTPRRFPDEEATARASRADDILENAVLCDSLPQALEGCSMVFGASARSLRSLPWPQLDARATAELVSQQSPATEVALVFGREHSGLTNEELGLCNYLLHIPTNPDFSSLNVAAAIQVVAYELMMSRSGEWQAPESNKVDEAASAEEVEGLITHMEQTMIEVGFLDPDNPRQLVRRLRRLFNRARVERTEVNILRGVLSAVNRLKR